LLFSTYIVASSSSNVFGVPPIGGSDSNKLPAFTGDGLNDSPIRQLFFLAPVIRENIKLNIVAELGDSIDKVCPVSCVVCNLCQQNGLRRQQHVSGNGADHLPGF